MLKCIDPIALGLNTNFMQVVELALTHRFKGIEIDLENIQSQVDSQGIEQATRSLKHAPYQRPIFKLPLNWFVPDNKLSTATTRLHRLLDTAVALGCQACEVTIRPFADTPQYHESFELHSRRLKQLGEELETRQVRLGVGFQAHPSARGAEPYPFISTADGLVALVKMTSNDNLGVVVDTWNWHLGGGNPELLTELGPDRLVAIRMADFPPGIQPNSATEQERVLPRSDGTGQSLPLLSAAIAAGFNGSVLPSPAPSQVEEMGREDRVRNAAESLTAAIEAAKPVESVTT